MLKKNAGETKEQGLFAVYHGPSERESGQSTRREIQVLNATPERQLGLLILGEPGWTSKQVVLDKPMRSGIIKCQAQNFRSCIFHDTTKQEEHVVVGDFIAHWNASYWEARKWGGKRVPDQTFEHLVGVGQLSGVKGVILCRCPTLTDAGEPDNKVNQRT